MSTGSRSSAVAFVALCAGFAFVLAACKREDTARTLAMDSAIASGISAPSPASPPNADYAPSLVNRFIVAESVGTWRVAHSLVAWRACHWDPATDFLLVTTAIQVRRTGPVGDSALVQVIYDVVGRA